MSIACQVEQVSGGVYHRCSGQRDWEVPCLCTSQGPKGREGGGQEASELVPLVPSFHAEGENHDKKTTTLLRVTPALANYSGILLSDIPPGKMYGIGIVTFYLAFCLAYTLTFYLTFYGTFFLAFYMIYILTFDIYLYLAFFLVFYLTYVLTFYLAVFLAFYLAYILTFYLAVFLALCLAYILIFYKYFAVFEAFCRRGVAAEEEKEEEELHLC